MYIFELVLKCTENSTSQKHIIVSHPFRTYLTHITKNAMEVGAFATFTRNTHAQSIIHYPLRPNSPSSEKLRYRYAPKRKNLQSLPSARKVVIERGLP